MIDPVYASVFVMGLLGGTHCAGMCGGIVSALSMSLSPQHRNSSNRLAAYLLLYNVGRISSYAMAGFIVATFSGVLTSLADGMMLRQIFTWLSAGLMILLGLYLAGWWPNVILKIEYAGQFIWKLIQPLAQKFIPVQSPVQALAAGLLWGWLPCGLVYTALLWTLSAHSSAQGALIMVSFGLGTLPAMLGIGFFSARLLPYMQKQWLRVSTGVLMIAFGIYQLLTF